MTIQDDICSKRDAKAKPHLQQYAPVWKIDEQIFVEDESVQFNVLFQHINHGWVSRRYRYDAFNDTLYHKGQQVVSEDDALEYMTQEPYIEAIVTDIPNSYGG